MTTVTERIMQRTDRSGDCWLWTGFLDRYGYGQISVQNRREKAHRAAYEAFVGPIPDGLVIDHTCRVRRCVNPAHLEPVTHAENVRRGIAPNARKTQCPKGHVYDDANTYRAAGRRDCRACRREATRRYEARKQAAQ
jgi:hypothetical protein